MTDTIYVYMFETLLFSQNVKSSYCIQNIKSNILFIKKALSFFQSTINCRYNTNINSHAFLVIQCTVAIVCVVVE